MTSGSNFLRKDLGAFFLFLAFNLGLNGFKCVVKTSGLGPFCTYDDDKTDIPIFFTFFNIFQSTYHHLVMI